MRLEQVDDMAFGDPVKVLLLLLLLLLMMVTMIMITTTITINSLYVIMPPPPTARFRCGSWTWARCGGQRRRSWGATMR